MEWLHLIVLKSHSLPASFTFPHYLSLLNQSTYLLSMLFLCRLPPCRSEGKESACNAGDLGLIPGLGRSPGGGHGNPFHSSCLENLHGQRSLETDTTEHLTHTHTHIQTYPPTLSVSCDSCSCEILWTNCPATGFFLHRVLSFPVLHMCWLQWFHVSYFYGDFAPNLSQHWRNRDRNSYLGFFCSSVHL